MRSETWCIQPWRFWHLVLVDIFFVEGRNSSFYSYIGLQLDKEKEETKTSLTRVNAMFYVCDVLDTYLWAQLWSDIRELKQLRRRGERERQKNNNNFARASRFFCTFLSRRCTTTTWKWPISSFVEDRNTRQQLSFSFPELWYSPLEFNSKKSCQHLTI